MIFFKARCCFLALCLLLFSNVQAQDPYSTGTLFSFGASSMGMGNASMFTVDTWSSVNAIGRTSQLDNPSIAIGHNYSFQELSLSTKGVAAVFPFKHFVLSTSFLRFGDAVLSEQDISVGIAHQIGIVEMGLGTSWRQVGGNYLNHLSALLVHYHLVAHLSDYFSIGLNLKNIGQNNYEVGEFGADISSLYALGFEYKIDDELRFVTEINKLKYHDLSYKIGLEYSLHKSIIIRGGTTLFPVDIYLGTTVLYKYWSFDYAFATDDIFGWSHQFSLEYTITKRK
ncbi:hypothetical protein EI427_00420 [Flammeovirga pectinis]|uniref:PorV/PorQ family protein n=1 Tax=Flammeovirga pectinis TaxID=2494373 RepID=A0A3Q9FMU7_9BACT|nr:hypothetical protein [Flammeovirga pectinis]AZQ60724.1 hypothetical protein EI427_00420 [Flammeovirga pectinis]